jgi:hypothetical protein
VLHTPLPVILALTQAEAIEWYAACARFQGPPPTTEH